MPVDIAYFWIGTLVGLIAMLVGLIHAEGTNSIIDTEEVMLAAAFGVVAGMFWPIALGWAMLFGVGMLVTKIINKQNQGK
jgi:hypothetical protein